MAAYEISWIKADKVLYVCYHGYQTSQTIKGCLDDEAAVLDQTPNPVAVIVDWSDVPSVEPGALTAHINHRLYTHPHGKFVILVGFDKLEAFLNDLTIQRSHKRQQTQKNNRYVSTLAEAKELAKDFLA